MIAFATFPSVRIGLPQSLPWAVGGCHAVLPSTNASHLVIIGSQTVFRALLNGLRDRWNLRDNDTQRLRSANHKNLRSLDVGSVQNGVRKCFAPLLRICDEGV